MSIDKLLLQKRSLIFIELGSSNNEEEPPFIEWGSSPYEDKLLPHYVRAGWLNQVV